MSARGEDRIDAFERHCGLLLRAYPAAYRNERGEEITGTLLETTPDGRAWPVPADIRGLVIGGLRARAALNRCRTTAANLRIAVLVGITAYFAFNTAWVLHFVLAAAGQPRSAQLDMPLILIAPLSMASALIAWVSRRRAIVLIFAVPAAAAVAIAGPWQQGLFGSAVTSLACLAALIAVAGPERPNRHWLWPIGVVVLSAMLLPASHGAGADLVVTCVLSVVFASIVYFAVDARPVIALVVFLLALSLPTTIEEFASGVIPPVGVPLLAICSAVAAIGIWRLRRQSADRARSRRI